SSTLGRRDSFAWPGNWRYTSAATRCWPRRPNRGCTVNASLSSPAATRERRIITPKWTLEPEPVAVTKTAKPVQRVERVALRYAPGALDQSVFITNPDPLLAALGEASFGLPPADTTRPKDTRPAKVHRRRSRRVRSQKIQ